MEFLKKLLTSFEERFASKAGMIYILVQSLSFTCGGVFIKSVQNLSIAQTIVYRGVIMIIITNALINKYKLEINPKDKGVWSSLMARGLLGGIGIMANFYACTFTTLLEVNCIVNLAPMVIGLLGYVILKEPYKKIEMTCALISFCGFLIMVQKPDFFFKFIRETLFGEEYDSSPVQEKYKNTRSLGIALSFVSMFCYSIVTIVIRRKKTGINPFIFLQYFNICCQLFSPLILINDKKMGWPSTLDYLFIVILTVFSFVGQLCRTRGVQLDKAGKVAIFNYSRIVFSYLFDILIFKENPDLFSTMGAFLIFFPAVILFYSDVKLAD